jgi:hypothetical protein
MSALSSSVTTTDGPPAIVPIVRRTVRTNLQCAAVAVYVATVLPGELVSVCFLITMMSVANIVLRRWYMTGLQRVNHWWNDTERVKQHENLF